MISFDQIWNDKFLVDIPLIDQHHKILIGLVVDLRNELESGRFDREFALSMVESLKSYAKYHFMAEERFMFESRYEALAEHRIEHQEFSRIVDEFLVAMLKSDHEVGIHLLSFLKNWLVDHILVKDRDFGDFYEKRFAGR